MSKTEPLIPDAFDQIPDDLQEKVDQYVKQLRKRMTAQGSEDALRLEVIETDACRRFHADFVTLRLLSSYVGPGTQWCRANAADAICEVPTGAVGVFKGRLLLDPPTILHRSPPIGAIATGSGWLRRIRAISSTPPSGRGREEAGGRTVRPIPASPWT